MNTKSTESPSLACNLTAIPAQEREEHIITAPQLFQTVQEVQELPDGYAFRFLNESGKFMAVAKYIENERLCCPFFNFSLEVQADSGGLWLKLTGSENVKELLKASLLENLGGRDDLKNIIHTGGDAHLDEIVAHIPLPQMGDVLNKTSDT